MIDHYVAKLQEMRDIEEEAKSRGMKNINIWPDHILIELQSKTIKVFYNGIIKEISEGEKK